MVAFVSTVYSCDVTQCDVVDTVVSEEPLAMVFRVEEYLYSQ
jgi:hypothetical protein